jgi:hypothetical protein
MQPETAPVRTNTMTRNNFTKSAEEPTLAERRRALGEHREVQFHRRLMESLPGIQPGLAF